MVSLRVKVKKYVVANISVKNTTKETFVTGNYDFIGYMEASEDGHLDTADSFTTICTRMKPNWQQGRL